LSDGRVEKGPDN
jgi:hypothetical protein